jgi:hypothetical protein
MPIQYGGIASNITGNFPPVSTVTGATNASPIVIQTSAAHGLTSGDSVRVAGVQGNAGANGTWVATVVDSTHFSMLGSVGSGAYTTGGTAQSLAIGPSYAIPIDGEARSAASMNVALEALGDRTAALGRMTGQYKLHRFYPFSGGYGGGPAWGSATVSASNTWTPFSGTPLSGAFTGIVSDGESADIIEVELATTLYLSGGSPTSAMVGLTSGGYQPGGSAALVNLNASQVLIQQVAYNVAQVPICLKSYFQVGSGGPVWDLGVSVNFPSTTGTASLQGGWTAIVKQWRPTGYTQ